MSTNNTIILNATKWSSITAVVSRLVTPVSSIVLAHILLPEVFGIVAAIFVIVSFCDLFADAGFQKYIIQHELGQREDLNHFSYVAFWTNFILSIVIWLIISFFSKTLSELVGCPGKEAAVIVAGCNLPLHALTSIQSARLKRELNFKPLFFVQMIAISVPFAVTIPLAYFTRSYWSIIIGSISMNAATAIALVFLLKWIPKFEYNFDTLKKMFGFSMWSMFESVLVWTINWGDTFIVSNILIKYYLGLYTTSINMTNQIFGVVSASIVPVLLSALSREQNNKQEFKTIFYRTSFISGLLLLPLGVGLFIYKKTLCGLLLGSVWSEASVMVGIWGLVSALAILFNSFNGCVLIANGKPKVSVYVQLAQIFVIIPTVYFSAHRGFVTLSYARALVRLFGMVLYSIVVWKMFQISFILTIKLLVPAIIGSSVMGCFGFLCVKLNKGYVFEITTMICSVGIYTGILLLFSSTRDIIRSGIQLMKKTLSQHNILRQRLLF